MVLVQLNVPNGDMMKSIANELEMVILDIMGEETWLLRLPEDQATALASLQSNENIRWWGSQHPGWRLSPSLMTHPEASSFVHLVPASDLPFGGYGTLATDLVRYGATEAACDAWSCTVSVNTQTTPLFVQNIAHDGRVLWAEPGHELRVHNALAWSVSGVQNTVNNATFTLDGSGEMIAIADTGLDSNHPDLTGRVAATYTQFGLDPSPADTNGGHGTHIATTVLGNGTGDAAARGMAPSATLVMYALEHDPLRAVLPTSRPSGRVWTGE
jgi:hypothetical protein